MTRHKRPVSVEVVECGLVMNETIRIEGEDKLVLLTIRML